MPNRILKESICTSETIDGLSAEAEVLWYRLLVQCDDFGRYDARPCVIRARCFPLRLDRVSDQDVMSWMQELVRAGLLWIYTAEGREWVQITTWRKHQQVRATKSKYPDPPSDALPCKQLIADAINCNQLSPYSETESYSYSETGARESRAREKTSSPPFLDPVEHMLTARAEMQPGIADPAQDAERWMQYRDKALKAYQQATGLKLAPANRDLIIALAGEPEFILSRWQQSITSCIAGGVKPSNVGCMVDTYRDGGDYKAMLNKRNNGQHGRPPPDPPGDDWSRRLKDDLAAGKVTVGTVDFLEG